MKNPQEIEELRSKLNSSELTDLNWLHTELGNFLDSDDVSSEGVIKLENMINTLNLTLLTNSASPLQSQAENILLCSYCMQ